MLEWFLFSSMILAISKAKILMVNVYKITDFQGKAVIKLNTGLSFERMGLIRTRGTNK